MNGVRRKRADGVILALSFAAVIAAGLPACAGKEDRIREAFRGFKGRYVLYITKSLFLLEVFDRNCAKVASYTVAYGSAPDGGPKLYEGDNRTPEGIYHVNEILSMDADVKSPSYRILRDMNKKYFRASEGHSKWGREGVDLGDNAYGPRFYGLDYPNENDRRRYREARRRGILPLVKGKIPGIGYGIGIHGNNDEAGVGQRSSSGCIRMYNRDVVDLERFVQLGTPVIIVP